MDVVAEFWLSDPQKAGAILDSLTGRSPYPVTTLRYGTSFRGRELVAFQAGEGPLRAVMVGGMHAAEMANGFGMLAFAHTLSTGRSPWGEDLGDWVTDLLRRQTITLVPFHNIDGAVRMSQFLPGAYTRNRFSASDWDEYLHFVRDPIMRFGLTRGIDHFLTDEQMRIFVEEEGGMLGQLWSEQGVDLWEDWLNLRAPETRALRAYLDDIRPDCIFELHNHEGQSQMFVPIPAARGRDRSTQLEYGERMMTALMEEGIPCSRHSVRTYGIPESLNHFPDVAYERYRCLILFAEVCFGLTLDRQRELARSNPLGERDADLREPTQDEIIRTVWVWLRALVDMGGERGYR